MLSQYLRLCSYSRGGVRSQTMTMQVFGLWEEAGLLGENHGENMETPDRKARSQESNLQLSPLQHRITLCRNSSPYTDKMKPLHLACKVSRKVISMSGQAPTLFVMAEDKQRCLDAVCRL